MYISDKITDEEYTKDNEFDKMTKGLNVHIVKELHLAVSLRSFRSENVSAFVKALLDMDIELARSFYKQFKNDYPICITRD